MQKVVRGYLVRKAHKHRYKGIIKIRGLLSKLKELESVASQLSNDYHNSSQKEIQNLESAIVLAVKLIKVIIWLYKTIKIFVRNLFV